MNKINGFLLAFAGAVVLSSSASAQAVSTGEWTGAAGNNKLDDKGNWKNELVGVVITDWISDGQPTGQKTGEFQYGTILVATGKSETWDLSEASHLSRPSKLGELVVEKARI